MIFIYRTVSLDLIANVSSVVKILCNQNSCDLVNPRRMAVVKGQMYILHNKFKISLFEGE